MKIAISAGHGYMTAGKRTCKFPDGRQMREHEFNRDVVYALDYRLRQAGHKTILCFDEIGASDMRLEERVERANTGNADIYVSVHANAIGEGITWHSVNGLVSMTYPGSIPGRKLARSILPELSKTTNMPIQSYQEVAYYEPANTTMPCIIVECGFMTNLNDASKMLTYEYRQQCAEGIFNGITLYFDTKKAEESKDNAIVLDIPKATLNTIKTYKSVKELAEEHKNFINGMFFSWDDKSLFDMCISNEVYLENKGAIRKDTKPKGTFYLYKDGRCGVGFMRTMSTPKDLQMLVQGIDLKNVSSAHLEKQGWDLIDPNAVSNGAAIGYNYKEDQIKIIMMTGTLFDLQRVCKNNGLVDENGDVCAISLDRGGSFAHVRNGKIMYNTNRYMRNIIFW